VCVCACACACVCVHVCVCAEPPGEEGAALDVNGRPWWRVLGDVWAGAGCIWARAQREGHSAAVRPASGRQGVERRLGRGPAGRRRARRAAAGHSHRPSTPAARPRRSRRSCSAASAASRSSRSTRRGPARSAWWCGGGGGEGRGAAGARGEPGAERRAGAGARGGGGLRAGGRRGRGGAQAATGSCQWEGAQPPAQTSTLPRHARQPFDPPNPPTPRTPPPAGHRLCVGAGGGGRRPAARARRERASGVSARQRGAPAPRRGPQTRAPRALRETLGAARARRLLFLKLTILNKVQP
jgi:hypothetical protein